jgi:hypothetical protein
VEKAQAGGRGIPLPVCGRPLREGESGWASGQPGDPVRLGVRDDGYREILAVEIADTESEATYQELFQSLKRRGLSEVELVVSE